MENKDKYLLADFAVTFLIFISTIMLFDKNLSISPVYLISGLLLGFLFSWFYRGRNFRLIRISIDIIILGICIWMGYAIMNSTFLFSEAIAIFTQGIIYMQVIFSFYNPPEVSTKYIRILSVPLVMICAFLVKYYNIALLLFYFICWLAIFKLKFYNSFMSVDFKNFRYRYPVILTAAWFILVVFTAFALFYNVLLEKVHLKGFFLSNINAIEPKGETPWEEYYGLQDELQEEITKIVFSPDYKGDKQEVLFQLSSLLKDSPEINEVLRAKEGLEDHLKRPGMGLEESDTEKAIILVDKYFRRKITFNLDRLKNGFNSKIRSDNSTLNEKFSSLVRINKMTSAESPERAAKYAQETKKIIRDSLISNKGGADLENSVKQIQEWKSLEFYNNAKNDLDEKINAESDESTRNELQNLSAEISSAQKASDLAGLKAKLQESKSEKNAQEELLNQAQAAIEAKSQFLSAGKGEETGGAGADGRAPSESPGVSSESSGANQQEEGEKKPRDEEASADKGTALSQWQLFYLLIWILCVLSLILVLIFAALYFITENKKKKLRSYIEKDPKKFIVDIYENIRGALVIFDVKNKILLAPLYYAVFLSARYKIEDETFLRFTEKFEEAKYSRHTLGLQDAQSALADYNNFLKIFSSRYKKIRLHLKYPLLILHRIPLYI